MGELRNCRGNFQALVENDFLALKANVFRPFYETSHISLGTDILTCMTSSVRFRLPATQYESLTDTEVFRGSLEERVLLDLSLLAGAKGGGSRLLTGSGLGFGRLVIETKSATTFKKN